MVRELDQSLQDKILSETNMLKVATYPHPFHPQDVTKMATRCAAIFVIWKTPFQENLLPV
jgi:hypothetical protein